MVNTTTNATAHSNTLQYADNAASVDPHESMQYFHHKNKGIKQRQGQHKTRQNTTAHSSTLQPTPTMELMASHIYFKHPKHKQKDRNDPWNPTDTTDESEEVLILVSLRSDSNEELNAIW